MSQLRNLSVVKSLSNYYVTKRMENSISSQVGEPEWIVDYGFDEKLNLQEQIQEKNERVSEFQNLERLLYSTGDLLENSIEKALNRFGFDPETTTEDEDMVIRDDDHVYVMEIKGVNGKIDKSDVDQLGGWISKKIDDGIEDKNLTGVLVYNHQRDSPPNERDNPFTSKVTEFLNHHRASRISTHNLFKLAKRLEDGDLSEDKAHRDILDQI
jgi:hypothetical protein